MRTLMSMLLIAACGAAAPALAEGVNDRIPTGAPSYYNAQPGYTYNPSPTMATPNQTTNWGQVDNNRRYPAQPIYRSRGTTTGSSHRR